VPGKKPTPGFLDGVLRIEGKMLHLVAAELVAIEFQEKPVLDVVE